MSDVHAGQAWAAADQGPASARGTNTSPPQSRPELGWCLALYPRLSPRARRRLAAMLIAAALVAQPLAGYARRERRG